MHEFITIVSFSYKIIETIDGSGIYIAYKPKCKYLLVNPVDLSPEACCYTVMGIEG